MDKSITRRIPKTEADAAIMALADVIGLTPEVVRDTLLKSSPERLRATTNAAGLLARFMNAGGTDLVNAVQMEMAQTIAISALLDQDFGPSVDLSELADEVEANLLQAA